MADGHVLRGGATLAPPVTGWSGGKAAVDREARVASVEQCTTALESILDDLASNPAAAGLDRSISCRLTDLGKWIFGRLRDGAVHDLHVVPDHPPPPKADIRLAMTSDDLVALTEGNLHFGHAWASGRVSFHAGFRDILRLRNLL